tara:strand:+ start:570 stop:767 length:198 start_codon:yes stop_codon:yes gene_type:complete
MMSEIEIWLPVAALVAAFGVWAYKRYQVIMADGKVSLDEIIDAVTEGTDKVEEIQEAVEDAKDVE